MLWTSLMLRNAFAGIATKGEIRPVWRYGHLLEMLMDQRPKNLPKTPRKYWCEMPFDPFFADVPSLQVIHYDPNLCWWPCEITSPSTGAIIALTNKTRGSQTFPVGHLSCDHAAASFTASDPWTCHAGMVHVVPWKGNTLKITSHWLGHSLLRGPSGTYQQSFI